MNLHQTLLLRAIRKAGCKPVDVQEIEENLIEMSLLPLNSENPVYAVFRIIPWQKCLGEVAVVSGRHKNMSRRQHKERKTYYLAFVYTRKVILIRPLALPSCLKSYPSADEDFITTIVDLKVYGKEIKC
ncbi:MAG TPA: hypothetical protein PKV50_03275 [Prolixibacteraceae bacterium]|nr:MAG: hypothetical protein BWX77_00014 [Bacteroidetes bacterium ADurb.Bin090]HUM88526.1 hypothetical protein [Prolixibacteraceae bacterium]